MGVAVGVFCAVRMPGEDDDGRNTKRMVQISGTGGRDKGNKQRNKKSSKGTESVSFDNVLTHASTSRSGGVPRARGKAN
jgi:hypothetical protein